MFGLQFLGQSGVLTTLRQLITDESTFSPLVSQALGTVLHMTLKVCDEWHMLF